MKHKFNREYPTLISALMHGIMCAREQGLQIAPEDIVFNNGADDAVFEISRRGETKAAAEVHITPEDGHWLIQSVIVFKSMRVV